MLAANIAVAQLLASRDIPFLRRAHGTPDELRLKNFKDFCSGLGFELQKYQSRTEIQELIHSVAGQPEERAINFALLRAMKQAEYSPEETGHYALNEDDYCHFTSPIRRYPDLMIHRIIGELAAGQKPSLMAMSELIQLGKNCSLTERRAERAERELKRIRLLRFLEDKVGQEMDAFITGVESFGVFCQGQEIPAEGLVHISSLSGDFYSYDQTSRMLIGERTDHRIQLGDSVRVLISGVDVDRRQLDLRLAEEKTTQKRRRPKKKASSRPGRKSKGAKNAKRKSGGRSTKGKGRRKSGSRGKRR